VVEKSPQPVLIPELLVDPEPLEPEPLDEADPPPPELLVDAPELPPLVEPPEPPGPAGPLVCPPHAPATSVIVARSEPRESPARPICVRVSA
jgi:hypothetical protein